MGEGKINSLMILCTESENTLEIDLDHLVDKFAQFKQIKKQFL